MPDLKITGLTADTTPTSDDLIPTVTDPAGTPANRKVTLANAITKAHGLSDSTVVGVASGVLTSGTDVAVVDGGTGASTASGARTNLGLVIGTDVAPVTSPTLVTPVLGEATGTGLTLSGLTASEMVITNGSKKLVSAAVATYPSLTELTYVKGVTSALQTQLDAKQASDAELTALAGLTSAADKVPYFTGSGTAALSDFSAFGRSLVDDATASNARTTLGLGTVATLASDTDVTLAANSDSNVATQKAVKSYVDAVVQGLSVKASCLLATAEALPTNTYLAGVITITATGTLTVDGTVTALNDRILVKDESAALKNGIYKVTTAGAIGIAAVLTRSTDMDVAAEFPGAFVFVETGTVNAAAGFVCTNSTNPTVGTDAINFTQFSGAGEITAGSALTKTGNTLDVAVDNSSIEVSGDALRVKSSGVTSAMLAGSIDATKIADGTVTSTEFQYIGGLTSDAQTQLAARLPLAGGTMTGDITLGENTSIALDPAGSADGKYSGTTIAGTAGEALAFGDVIVLDVTAGKWLKGSVSAAAGADGDLRGGTGMCVLAAAGDASATKVLLYGNCRADANFPALTIGSVVYATTAGDITVTRPSTTDHVIKVLGFALTADEIMFCPSMNYITNV